MPRLLSARTLVLGGLALAAYGAVKNKRAITGLLGGGNEPTGGYGPAPAPPVANADVAGPPANTATHVPAPEPAVHVPGGGIDEAAEEAAAAAEAANIGGPAAEYSSEDDPTRPLDEALRPLEEAGEGVAEGQELAEADLIDNAEPSAGDPIEGERAIEDAIEEQDEPRSGERLDAPPPSGAPAEDVPPPEDAPPAAAATPSGTAMPQEATPAAEKSSAVWRVDDQPTLEAEAVDDDKS
ncbi:MAG: hypothetical protein QOD55_312 [Solirubrobacteraceae bacterium]|jgi:hypothetical protein|nr:hypothetical protein [Solirubrobacteraceae bacterium]